MMISHKPCSFRIKVYCDAAFLKKWNGDDRVRGVQNDKVHKHREVVVDLQVNRAKSMNRHLFPICCPNRSQSFHFLKVAPERKVSLPKP